MQLVASGEGVELMAGKRLTNPARSSNDLRGNVLRVLGVLKVATADQIQRIASPHLTYRHASKPRGGSVALGSCRPTEAAAARRRAARLRESVP
ncbi:hypothetical protein [Streptomyces nojiriensis]|uniref:hypothetical protein n=1 Tax=Streptomyces nojiriensis TaxID=66374 RepID=UPI0016796341|nr:hypothetical protein [Streptomyces nojiriensis]